MWHTPSNKLVRAIAFALSEDVFLNNGIVTEASFSSDESMLILTHPSVRTALLKIGIDTAKAAPIGSGGKGWAFRVGNVAIKITPDEQEARNSKVAMNCNNPFLAKILGVFAVSPKVSATLGLGQKFYVIPQEYVRDNQALSAQQKDAADAVGGFLDVINPPHPWDTAQVQQAFLDLQAKYGDDADPNSERNQFAFQILQAIDGIASSCGLAYMDAGATNLGFDAKGNLKLFDLGLSEPL